ncbi:unnamed protein product [Phytophthora fragariaefolia]|uniref:Unnamed protein product n=1 Tax=Phytophthora fragariaefolia TaxID=1490495 RepID=A0A9W7D925_9STRA|nr:unnamed protein product [Phytophthora fragariaefolia]
MAAQGSWPDKMKIRQVRGQMSSSLRDWYAQLPKSTRHNWKKLSRRFKVMYCRTTGSYSERYYTMKVRSGETPRKFFYRLNTTAVKAVIEFQKSSKHRERHLRRFIKKLKDTQLKTAVQGQKFKSISEVEHALRRHEDIWREEGYDTPPSRQPDPDSEPERRVRFEGLDDEVKPAAQVALAKGRDKSVSEPVPAETQPVFKVENITKEIYRVLDAEGWRPPPQFGNADLRSRPMSPRSSNSPWQRTCESCGRIGHSKENCWADLTCDRCHQQGHPTEACRANPCPGCNQFHRGFSCEDWRAIQAVKKKTRQGALNDQTLDALQTGEADSGKKPLNH